MPTVSVFIELHAVMQGFSDIELKRRSRDQRLLSYTLCVVPFRFSFFFSQHYTNGMESHMTNTVLSGGTPNHGRSRHNIARISSIRSPFSRRSETSRSRHWSSCLPSEGEVCEVVVVYSRTVSEGNCNMVPTFPSSLLQLSPWHHYWQNITPFESTK